MNPFDSFDLQQATNPNVSFKRKLMKVRITLINNANQQQKAVVVVDENATVKQLISISKNKLKIKTCRLFSTQTGRAVEIDAGKVLQNNEVILCSSGENPVFTESAEISSISAVVKCIHNLSTVEITAIEQLERVGKFPGMLFCIGMPDLHAGNSTPIGAVFATKDKIYPELIGGDIGCGISLFKTALKSKNVVGRESKIANQLQGLEGSMAAISITEWLDQYGLQSNSYDSSLGTIGRGNHFAELQMIDEIIDDTVANLDKDLVYLVVHSGSRGFGKEVLETYGESEQSVYLNYHDQALKWAQCNRDAIADRFSKCVESEVEKVSELWHNFVEEKMLQNGQKVFLHRKGAIPSDKSNLLILPGSRGTKTYLLQPIGNQEGNGYSIAHGAGREMSRSKALSKFSNKFKSKKEMVQTLTENQFGGVVVCEDLDLLCEETPEAYKDVDLIVQDLVDLDIVKIVAVLKPLVTYKMRG